MQQFVVPQFIDVEDKIIGPITVRQFVIMLVGSGFSFIAYKLSDFVLFLLQFVVIMFVSFSLAFIKVNGRPIHYLLLNFLQTWRRPKVKVWLRQFTTAELKAAPVVASTAAAVKPRLEVKSTRLAELSLIVDTGGIYQGEEPLEPKLS